MAANKKKLRGVFMKSTKIENKTNKEVQDCLEKILDFARAISLDGEDMTAGCIALTMADEIQAYGVKALDLLAE